MQKMQKSREQIARWRHDPVAFVREVFGVEPDPWQKKYLIAYNNNQRVAAKACKGPGKTCVQAWCAWHFLVTRPHPKIAATSISSDNLGDGLWTEMAKWQIKSKLLVDLFVWTKTRIYARQHPETWWMSARSWSKSASAEQQADTLAGLHADYILFIIDEAGGVPDAVAVAAEAALSTGIECKLLLTGNPTHLSGPLYRACTKEKADWIVIEITGDPDDPMRSSRICIEWARKQIRDWGRHNAWVLVNVFGKFPPSSLNGLLGPDDMAAAVKRIVSPDSYNQMPKILGVDVALQGDDRTVIAPRQGIVGFHPKVLRTPKPIEIASVVAHSWDKWEADACFIDNTGGWGSGVISHLEDWGYAPIGIQFAGKADDAQYKNKRAEMAFNFAKWIKAGGCLPDIGELTEESTAITFFHTKDQVQIVEKKQIKEELGRSPDLFDAYGLTFAYPVQKRDPLEKYRNKSPEGNYDPISAEYPEHQGGDHMSRSDYNPLH